MSPLNSEKVAFTFFDVAACFSEEEWKLLHEWQNELYKNVMKEIHQALVSLGPFIATNIFSLKAKEKEDVCSEDHQDPERRQHGDHSSRFHYVSSETILPVYQKLDDQAPEERMNSSVHSSGHEIPIPNIESSIKEEMETYPTACVNRKEKQNAQCPSRLSFLADESEASFMAEGNRPAILDSDCLLLDPEESSKGDENILTLNSTLHPVSSVYIKAEDNASSMDFQDSVRNNRKECATNPIDTKLPVNSSTQQQLCIWEEASASKHYGRSKSHTLDVTDYHNSNRSESVYTSMEYNSSFNRRSKPIKVKRTLIGKKPYTCSEYLSPLQNTQTGLENYICSQCGSCFNQLRNNITKQEITNGEQQSICSECEKSLPKSQKKHIDQETYPEERPYKCTECGKSFRKSQTLMIHQRVHTGEKPYPCSKCGKHFRQLAHLVKHQRMHLGEKPYICNICERRFIDSSHLKRHQQIHTRIPRVVFPRRGMETIKWTVEG